MVDSFSLNQSPLAEDNISCIEDSLVSNASLSASWCLHWGENTNPVNIDCLATVYYPANSSSEVMLAQRALKALDYLPDSYEENGDFDPTMQDAVRAFQRDERESVDGVVGPDTWKALNSALNQENSSLTQLANSPYIHCLVRDNS